MSDPFRAAHTGVSCNAKPALLEFEYKGKNYLKNTENTHNLKATWTYY